MFLVNRSLRADAFPVADPDAGDFPAGDGYRQIVMSASVRPLMIVVATTTLCLAGCQGQARGVSIPPGFEDLPTCPVAQVPISELSAMGEPGCDLAGTSLTFAEDTLAFAVGPPPLDGGVPALTIPSVGAVFSQGDGKGRELLIVNWGVPGVAVAAIDDGRAVQMWASSAAAQDLQLQQLAIEDVVSD
ncbi:hypothetical protein ACLQ2Q_17740 [Microbacterium sp. DT81.1]|uniref:hypothetical protein n=1 Tax=Microbacterium sp. DT81.1 TaxID=3393413 RepID=UPI003CE736C6